MSWYVQLMGETLGPYSGPELRKMAEGKHIDFDTPVARSKDGPWMTAQRIAGLFGPAESVPFQSAPSGRDPAGRDTTRESPAADQHAAHRSAEEPPAVELPDDGSRYKVLTQRDRWFGGRFEVEKLEGAINAYSIRGWRVCGVATAIVTGLAGKREEVVVVMERERVGVAP